MIFQVDFSKNVNTITRMRLPINSRSEVTLFYDNQYYDFRRFLFNYFCI